MRSYAAIDRMEGKFAVCEVELIPVEKSLEIDVSEKETEMMDIQLNMVTEICSNISEGDIFIVEHNNSSISKVYEKDTAEKQRRIELLESLV